MIDVIRCTAALTLLASPSVSSLAQAQRNNDAPTFTVGTATAQRGTTATGTIPVPVGSDSGLSIPVAVIHGARPGPVVASVASTTSSSPM